MKIGDLVMLIGWEDPMPPLFSIGEIVAPMDRGDWPVEFPGNPCEAGPDTSWDIPQGWLVVIPESGVSLVIEACQAA